MEKKTNKQTKKKEEQTLHPNQLNINVQRRCKYRDHPLDKIALYNVTISRINVDY